MQSVLTPAVVSWFAVVLVLGAAFALWLRGRRLVVTAAAAGLGAGWRSAHLQTRGVRVLVMLVVQLVSFALGVVGVVLSLPHQGGG